MGNTSILIKCNLHLHASLPRNICVCVWPLRSGLVDNLQGDNGLGGDYTLVLPDSQHLRVALEVRTSNR